MLRRDTILRIALVTSCARHVAAVALPQGSPGHTQTIGDYINSLIKSQYPEGYQQYSTNEVIANSSVRADWFGSYNVDFDDSIDATASEGIADPSTPKSKTKRMPDATLSARQADTSSMATQFKNVSTNGGYTISLAPGICTTVQVGTYNDPATGKGSTDGSIAAFAKSYLTTYKTDQEWRDLTRQNVQVIINRFLELVDSPTCPVDVVTPPNSPNFVIGQDMWTSNFLQTTGGLSTSFGAGSGSVVDISDSGDTTTTAEYALAIGYIIATCSSILFRLQFQYVLGVFEPFLLNLFAQFAANLAGSWTTCTNGDGISAAMQVYIESFSGSPRSLQSVAAPYNDLLRVEGNSDVYPLDQSC